MRIVIDTNSKWWANFKSISIGLLILFAILFVCGIIEEISGWDLDFFSGYFSASHFWLYKWRK